MQLRLGFKVNQRINTYLYQIVADLMERGQLAPQNHKYSIYREHSTVGDFRFCLIRKMLSPETDISGFDQRIIEIKYFIRGFCGSPARWYGLENSSVLFEYVPLFSKTKRQHKLSRRALEEVAPQVAAKLAESRESAEEDEDIFSVQMRDEREAQAEEAMRGLVGGDTASFRPLVIDEEDEGDEVEIEDGGSETVQEGEE